jgi:hypothetical protein
MGSLQDEDMDMEDLEEIDELFHADESMLNKKSSLASKYAKFNALAEEED